MTRRQRQSEYHICENCNERGGVYMARVAANREEEFDNDGSAVIIWVCKACAQEILNYDLDEEIE